MPASFSVHLGMGRKLRYAPEGGALFEITDRTIQGRPLFRPSRELNEIVLGVLGRAQRLHGVTLYSFVMLSGHYHMLVRVKDARQLAKFMQYFNSNLAKEIARLTGWKATIFPRRYQAIQVSDEEAVALFPSPSPRKDLIPSWDWCVLF